VSVGSLIARKAHDVSIRAIARARTHGCDVHLLLCGDGPDDAALRALARALGVERAVHLLGDRDDVGAVLRDAADVAVTSAREEAMPLGVLEAQALGAPVVASDIAAHAEALGDDGGGMLVPCEDPAALAEAIAALATDPAARARLGAAGRARAERGYAMERYVAAFAALYHELLAGGPRRAPGVWGLPTWLGRPGPRARPGP